MNPLPSVAIVGRPNVGKSSLFNSIMRERIAIEEPTEGVTRDRLICTTSIQGKPLDLVDTGGIGVVDKQSLEDDVNEQIEFAISSADLIILVVDAQVDITELDRTVAKRLHRTGIPVVLVANKADNEAVEAEAVRYRSLGFGEPIVVSVVHSRGIGDLLHKVGSLLPKVEEEVPGEDSAVLLALAGRRNVGKSSLINHLCGHKRVIASDVAGTTRDAIDVRLSYDGKDYIFIDTAGLRKKSQTEDSIEFFSVNRTFGALYRCQVGLLMLDSEQGISNVDTKLGAWFIEHDKPCIIVVNKWDLAGEVDIKEYVNYIHSKMPGLAYAPIVMISAKTGHGITHLFSTLADLRSQMKMDFPTPMINQVLHAAQQKRMPERSQGTIPKLYYGTCVKASPPTFIIFGKCTSSITDNYRRYLSQYFRDEFKMPNLPIRLVFKQRESMFKK